MKILFIGRSYGDDYNGGDKIFDEKLLRELRAKVSSLTEVRLERQRNSRVLSQALLGTSLPTYHRYDSAENAAIIKARAAEHDAVVVSHEALSLPFLKSCIVSPTLFIMHNMLSTIIGRAGVRGLFRARSRAVERSVAEKKNVAVAVLSSRERDCMQSLAATTVILLTPGVPKPFLTAPEKLVTNELFVGGSVDWGLKRRDYSSFLKHHARSELPPICAEDQIVDDAQLRIAVITDRFATGFKLKGSDLLRRNCAVISLSPILADFPARYRPVESVIEIRHPREIPDAILHIAERAETVASEIQALKASFSRELTWGNVGDVALNALKTQAALTR